MASSPALDSAAGYASVAAVAVSLSLAVIVVALMSRSVVAMKSARADFARTQAEYQLAGDQQRTALAMVAGKGVSTGLAEREAGKISLATAATLDAATLSRFGVQDPDRLAAWLLEASIKPTSPADLVAADKAALWRVCAPAAISAFGQAKVLAPPSGGGSGFSAPSSRLGEVWRLAARTADGWTDERIVRFTGEPQRPAAVIWRRFYRSARGGESCAAIFAQPTHG